MRFGSLSLGLGIAAITASGAWGSGCSPTKATEIVPGATTQIQVPLDLAAIRVDIRVGGAPILCQAYYANDGSLVLPATIGIIPGNGQSTSTTVTVEIRAYDTAGVNNQIQDLQSCGTTPVNQPGGPRILRRSIQSFVAQHEVFLPMPLTYSCLDKDCSTQADPTESCRGAVCASSQTDPTTLADFNSQLVDGTGNCFDTSQCFLDAAPALLVDASKCLFQFPEASVPASGLNVRVFYQTAAWAYNTSTSEYEVQTTPSSEQEVLNDDAVEGFTVPDSTKPQQFELAPGLCGLYQNSLTPPAAPTSGMATVPFLMISDVQVASACDPKNTLLPICAPEQQAASVGADGGVSTNVTCGIPLTLVPSPSILYMVVDNTHEMAGAFGPSGSVTALTQVLSNPVFKRTYVAYRFLDHCAGGSYTKPSVDFTLAKAAQEPIASSLINLVNVSSSSLPLDLFAAMNLDTGAFKEVTEFKSGLGMNQDINTAAVMFLLNRMPVTAGDAGTDSGSENSCTAASLTGPECPTVSGDEWSALATEEQNAAAAGLSTYFVVVSNNTPDAAMSEPPLCFYQDVATLAGQPTSNVVNATQSISQGTMAIQQFSSTMTALGTCVYDLPPGIDTSATLEFTVPVVTPANAVAPVSETIPLAPGCNAAAQASNNPPNGWNIEGKQIRICGAACSQQLQGAVGAVTVATTNLEGGTMLNASAVPEVPVTVKMNCASN